MARYLVDIVEELRKTVWCEADSPEEAKKKVRKSYEKSEIVLDADDFDYMELTEPELIDEGMDFQFEDYIEVK